MSSEHAEQRGPTRRINRDRPYGRYVERDQGQDRPEGERVPDSRERRGGHGDSD